jgi:hypothetical protein
MRPVMTPAESSADVSRKARREDPELPRFRTFILVVVMAFSLFIIVAWSSVDLFYGLFADAPSAKP